MRTPCLIFYGRNDMLHFSYELEHLPITALQRFVVHRWVQNSLYLGGVLAVAVLKRYTALFSTDQMTHLFYALLGVLLGLFLQNMVLYLRAVRLFKINRK